MVITRTPFRISFFGGGTDFPEFYREHGGKVLCTSINRYCYMTVHEINPHFFYRYRASYFKSETVNHPREFSHPLIRECLLHAKPGVGLEITHISDLPSRTGLGTSSSFTVGLLHALYTIKGDRFTPEDLARSAIHIERTRVGDAGGRQDQYAAAYGGLLRITFTNSDNVDIERRPLTCKRLKLLENNLLMFFTGTEQSAELVLQEQKKKTGQNISMLKDMMSMVDEADRILMSSGSLHGFGKLLHEAWMIKKRLAEGISNDRIDRLYKIALRCGALGGKILGAGGRGFLLVFAPPDAHKRLRAGLRQLTEVPFRFSMEGSQVIFKSSDR